MLSDVTTAAGQFGGSRLGRTAGFRVVVIVIAVPGGALDLSSVDPSGKQTPRRECHEEAGDDTEGEKGDDDDVA